MNESELLDSYRSYLNNIVEGSYPIPEIFQEQFWDWFLNTGKLFSSNHFIRNLINPGIRINQNACYKNAYNITKAFNKNLFYFEGFAFEPVNNDFLRHAYNVNKSGKVCDFTLRHLDNQALVPNYQIYFGIKIPRHFIKTIYQRKGDAFYTQYSILLPYFLYKNDYGEYLEYTAL